jgi:antirestriction protein ArdC
LTKTNYANVSLTEKEVEYLGLTKQEYISRGFLLYYRVFNIADTTGIQYEVPENKAKTETERIATAEAIVKGFTDMPPIVPGKDAAYNLSKDLITMPDISDFDVTEEYYTTLFHEMIHSTLHKSRIDRNEKYKDKDADAQYAFEELIAELGASYLAGLSGILNVVHVNSAAYLKGWHEKLQKITETNSNFFIFATKEAQKAVDYILKGFNFKDGQENDLETDIEVEKDVEKAKAKARAKVAGLKLKLKLKLRTKKT